MKQKRDTLYWSVYKNLERELIDLSRQIHFDDNQLSVYSVKIAELLVRCSIEIESISKDLYFQNGGTPIEGKDLYFDTDCLEFLEVKWLLSKKVVQVSASSFYFEKDENLILTPLYKANKRGTSGADWKKAYQAVKHNRSQNLSNGNLKNLIRALAALYLLNIYHRNEDKFDIGCLNNKKSFDSSLGSELFSIKMSRVDFLDSTGEVDYAKDYDEAVYFEKYKDEEYKKIVSAAKEDDEKINNILFNSSEWKTFNVKNPNYSFKDKFSWDVWRDVGGEDFMKRLASIRQRSVSLHFSATKEIVLNKNSEIYTEIDT